MNILIIKFHSFPFPDLINATSLNDNVGPTFEIEPPIRLDFTNNIGGRLDCVAKGIPHPNVEWFDADNNPVSTIQNVSGL